MKIELAGMNIDISRICELDDKESATPETISAAYARISRSSKSVTELRKDSLEEVEKSRKSNSTIIFEMGHSSIAEHAVFNFDVIGVSRYLTEFIQRSRLVSFTEKSQRYVTLKGDYVIPDEIRGTELEAKFSEIIKKQNELYFNLYTKAKDYLDETSFEGKKKELAGKAKEDARYVLSLATETQMGMTINARNLERLLRRLDRTGLKEAAKLRDELENAVKDLTPSLLKYTKADNYEKECLDEIPSIDSDNIDFQMLEDFNSNDDLLLASLIAEKNGANLHTCLKLVKDMSNDKKQAIFASIFEKMEKYHTVPRAFEMVDLCFQMTISSSCYAQLKRHRMSTILKSEYQPKYGYVVPPLIKKLNKDSAIKEVMDETNIFFHELEKIKRGLGAYILTNSHKLSVIFKTNLREIYHFSRLRSDIHAQWEIRKISKNIEEKVKNVYPLAGSFLKGKHEFRDNF